MMRNDFKGYKKGINLGGWLSQCCHTQEHYNTFITEKDFEEVSKWNIDHVRIPIDYNVIETVGGNVIESGMNIIQNAVDWCEKYNLNMVLDIHKTAGFSFDSGEKESGFFEDKQLQERFYLMWERLAERFGKYSDRVCFELLNEVTDEKYCDKWNEISENCISHIRQTAPDTYILLGGYWNNSILTLKDLRMPCDDKIVYNFHCYEPLIFTHQGAYWINNMSTDLRLKFPEKSEVYSEETKKLAILDLVSESNSETVDEIFFEKLFEDAVKIAEERNVQLYCGEYGVINLADTESTLNWYKAINKIFEKYDISRCAWCYKEMDFGITDEHIKPIKETIISYL